MLGFPSNQFPQEFGSSDKIAKYCSTTWGVTFPMMSKVKVDGKQQHPLHTELTTVPDAEGRAGKVRWNFEKFLVLPDGTVRRFRATTLPTAPEIVDSIETALPGGRN